VKILRRVSGRFDTLAGALGRRPRMGVKTGANGTYLIESISLRRGEIVDDLSGAVIPPQNIVRCVRGRDVRRWRATDSVWMLWPPPLVRGGSVPGWLRVFARSRGADPQELKLAYVRPEHLAMKVGWKDVSRGLQAVVIPPETSVGGSRFAVVPNQTVYFVDAATLDEAYAISAILNSSIAGAFALVTADRAKDAHFRYFGTLVASLPWPRVEPQSARWPELVRLARRAHRGAAVEGEIDELVGELYGIGAAERATLREFADARLELR
jgi:hypothetical protein